MKKQTPRKYLPLLAEHVSWWRTPKKGEKIKSTKRARALQRTLAAIIEPSVSQAFKACGRTIDDPDGWQVVCTALALAVFLDKPRGRKQTTTDEDERLINDVDALTREGRTITDVCKELIKREPYKSMKGRRAKNSVSIGMLTAPGLRSRYFDAKKRIARKLLRG